MRILIAIPALLILGACQVSKGSNEVSVSYNQEVAENTAAAVGNTAENIANDIGTDVKKAGEKLQNTDVSVKVNSNVQTENKSGTKTK
jgi:hypothetical protein